MKFLKVDAIIGKRQPLKTGMDYFGTAKKINLLTAGLMSFIREQSL